MSNIVKKIKLRGSNIELKLADSLTQSTSLEEEKTLDEILKLVAGTASNEECAAILFDDQDNSN